MISTIIKKSKSFAVIVLIAFFTMPYLCYSQSDLKVNEEVVERIIQKLEITDGITDGKQIKESVNYYFEKFSALPMDTIKNDSIKGTPEEKIIKVNDTTKTEEDKIKSKDSTRYNIFGDLLYDDTVYNKKYPLWIPVLEVLGVNAATAFVNRYIFDLDFGRIGFNSWKHNITTGLEWDIDRFGTNFLAHPYSGALFFLSARSNGYNYWESLPFAVGGSIIWEYFGEINLPSYNDIINTSVSGSFLGEIMYRLSSNILDDRTTGSERFLKELGAAVLCPTRFLNRLFQGKLTRVTSKEVYQTEPLNVELSAGMRKLNDESIFWTGSQNAMFSIQLDYGYPFEKRKWKPFDYFTVRAGINIGVGRKIVENITGYGVVFGKNVQFDNFEMLVGIFQHYDYFDNKIFEIGNIAFGGGIMSKYPVSKESYIFTNIHIGIVPLAGNSTHLGPDTTQFRDYNYGGGMEGKLDCGFNPGWGSFQFISYFYWIHTYVGLAGDNYIVIIKPRITIRLMKNVNIGFEHLIYYNDRYTRDLGNYFSVRTEQRIYLMINVGNFKL